MEIAESPSDTLNIALAGAAVLDNQGYFSDLVGIAAQSNSGATGDAGNVTVKMTLTTQGCPSALEIPDQVKKRIGAIDTVRDVKVDIVWEPAWNPSMISESGKQTLGIEEPT